MPKRRRPTGLSAKSERLLARWKVAESLAEGATTVAVGETYRLRDGTTARLAFARDDERRLSVGVAFEREGRFCLDESEPFSARALGYYQRRLKRIGVDVRELEEEGERE